MANNLTGKHKQGLGFALVSDYAQFNGMFSDPGTQNTARSSLSTVHAGTVNQKTSKPEELADAFTQEGVIYFDPTIPEQVALMTAAGGNQERDIYCVWPLVDKGDDVDYDNGYIHLPAGHIVSTSNAVTLEDYMKMNVRIEGGASSVTYQAQIAAVAPTSITFTQSAPTAAAADGDLLGTIASDFTAPSILTVSGGADAANVSLVGNKLYAVGAQAADLTINIKVQSWLGYSTDDTNYEYEEVGVTVDLTA